MKKKKPKVRNHLAKELWTPKFRPRVVQLKTKKKHRKRKHKSMFE